MDEAGCCDGKGIQAEIQYTKESVAGNVNGVVIGKGRFGLGNDAFFVQHGKILADDLDDEVEHSNELVSTKVWIENGRKKDLTFESHGIQLIDQGMNRFEDINTYYTQLEMLLKKLLNASTAKAFCHAARGKSEGFGTWAHTDHAPGSWSTRMNQNLAAEVLPPGLSAEDAQNASKAKRFAVVSVWRYLGPAQYCRKSHLALLDARSLCGSEDYLHFEIRTAPDEAGRSYSGHNYRLKAKQIINNYHRWLYFPDMNKDSEAILFLVYDSKPSFDSHCAIPTVFHSAFFDPSAPPDEPDRHSIDVRLLLTWDYDSMPNHE